MELAIASGTESVVFENVSGILFKNKQDELSPGELVIQLMERGGYYGKNHEVDLAWFHAATRKRCALQLLYQSRKRSATSDCELDAWLVLQCKLVLQCTRES